MIKENTINVSSSGFCLLEAFQIGFLADHKRLIKLETIKLTILKEFKKLITLKSYPEARLRELIMTDVVFAYENENKYEKNTNILTSSSWFDLDLNLIKVNTFKLTDYLENGVFNIDVVDFVPILLAQGFKCELNLFQYDTENSEGKFDEGVLFHASKFLPQERSGESLNGSFLSIPEINLVYLRNQMHYLTKTRVKPIAKIISRLKRENRDAKSIIPTLSKDEFYSKIATNFQKSRIIKYFNFFSLFFRKQHFFTFLSFSFALKFRKKCR